MGKKVLKLLLILFLILLCCTICLIGYRASLVFKIYKARDKVFESENVRIESDYKFKDWENNENWEKTIIYRKGNVTKYNFSRGEQIDDLENHIRIYISDKTFHSISKNDDEAGFFGLNEYPILKFYYGEEYDASFSERLKDKLIDIWFPLRFVLKGYPHIENIDGRDLISVQQGAYILYFDKETGIFIERYQLDLDGSTELMQKYNVQFDVVTDEDVDYGDISEYRYLTEE